MTLDERTSPKETRIGALRRLLVLLLRWKWTILLTWVLSVVVVAAQILMAWVAAVFIHTVLQGGEHDQNTLGGSVPWITDSLDGLADGILGRGGVFSTLIWGMGALLVLFVLVGVLRMIKLFLLEKVVQGVSKTVRESMFSHSLQLSINFTRIYRPGDVASLFVQDVEQLRFLFLDVTERLFIQPLRLVCAVILLFALSPYLTVVSLVSLGALMCLIHLLGNTIENNSRRLLEEKQRVQGYLVEQLSTAILGRAFDHGTKRHEEFSEHCEALSWRTRIYALTESVASEIEELLPMIARGVLLVLGAYEVMIAKSIDSALLIKMLMLFPIAVGPVSSLADMYVSIRISLAPARRVLRLLDLPREFHDDPSHPRCPGLESTLELRGVGYRIDSSEILHDVNMTIEKGRRYFVEGASGAGKTTLLNIVAGVYTATEGDVLVDGTPLESFQRSTWLARVGMVMQDPVMLNLTVRENLLLHGAPADDDRLFEVLDRVDLSDRIRRMRHGLGCSCGNRGELFSGGERQRLAIARALLADPEILILDEPVCMLDEANRERFRELLDRIAQGRTLIMAAHDRSLEDLADHQILVADRTVRVL